MQRVLLTITLTALLGFWQRSSAQLFTGGSGDGFSSDTTVFNFVDVPYVASGLFTGGSADGYTGDTTVFNFVVIPYVASALFTGGSGDGYAGDTTIFNVVEVPYIASGLFTGGLSDGFTHDSTEWESGIPMLAITVRLFLEGPFSNDSLLPGAAFLAAVPNKQPYGAAEFTSSDMYYAGADSFEVRPDSAVDWVLLSLRSDPDADSLVSGPIPALVMKSGWIWAPDGSSQIEFGNTEPDGYFLVVDHRNHLSVMSSDTLDLSDASATWDFTSSLSSAYQVALPPMKALPGGRYGLFACDITHDGQITATDFNLWLADTKAVATGYRSTDCSFDVQVTATDFNIWLANTKAVATSQVPR